jgi:hypothetical protein
LDSGTCLNAVVRSSIKLGATAEEDDDDELLLLQQYYVETISVVLLPTLSTTGTPHVQCERGTVVSGSLLD